MGFFFLSCLDVLDSFMNGSRKHLYGLRFSSCSSALCWSAHYTRRGHVYTAIMTSTSAGSSPPLIIAPRQRCSSITSALLTLGHSTFQLLNADNQHAGVMQGDAAVAKDSPSECQAADRPSQPGAGLAGRPALSHVLQCQPQDCSSGTTLLLAALWHCSVSTLVQPNSSN